MDSYFGKFVYRTIQNSRQEPVFECLQELEESQWYPVKRLRDLQWTRLLGLDYCKVPHLGHALDQDPLPLEVSGPEAIGICSNVLVGEHLLTDLAQRFLKFTPSTAGEGI